MLRYVPAGTTDGDHSEATPTTRTVGALLCARMHVCEHIAMYHAPAGSRQLCGPHTFLIARMSDLAVDG